MRKLEPIYEETREQIWKRVQLALPGMVLDNIHTIANHPDHWYFFLKNLDEPTIELLIFEAEQHQYFELCQSAKKALEEKRTGN